MAFESAQQNWRLLSTALIFGCSFTISSTSVCATGLNGKVEAVGQSTPLTGASAKNGSALKGAISGSAPLQGSVRGSAPLQGGVKDSESLRPSLKVDPAANRSLGGGVSQFAGGAQYSPGRAAPALPRAIPYSQRAVGTPSPRANLAVHVIPPIWSYTMTPKDGVMTWSSGYGVSHVPQPQSQRQRAVLRPAWQFGSGRGNLRPGNNYPIPASGVVSYAPNYAVSMVNRPVTRSGVGGYWSTSPRISQQGARAQARALSGTVRPAPQPQLSAQAQLLPELQAHADRIISWDQWYKRVGDAIYDVWKNADPGPGDAMCHVVVKKSRDVECQVTAFTPADGVERNVIKETAFREAALRAINLLEYSEDLQFPFMSNKPEVGFDIDMRWAVSGPVGCTVSPSHTVEVAKGSPTSGKN